MRAGGVLTAILWSVAVLGPGCGTPADEPCTPACAPAYYCYYGVCIPRIDGGTGDARDGDADARDDGGTPPPTGKVDLLFIVDNSGSMAEEQGMLTAAFPALTDALFDPPDGPSGSPLYPAVTDLNIAVISTDMGTAPYRVRSCEDGTDDGLFQHTPRLGGCDETYPAFLHETAASPDPNLAHDFACIATLGTLGCGFEQPFAAVEKALTTHAAAGGPNAGFVRSDAALALVFVSDENDCSPTDPALFDPEGTGQLGLRCIERADDLVPVREYADMLLELKAGGRLAAVMMVGVPPTLPICNTTGDVIAPCLDEEVMEETISTSTGQPVPVCEHLPETRAFPGRRFIELATKLGARAVVQSICDPQFETLFQKLARIAQGG